MFLLLEGGHLASSICDPSDWETSSDLRTCTVDIWIDFEYNLWQGTNHLGELLQCLGQNEEVLKLKKKIFTFLLVMKRNARGFSADLQLQCLDTIVQVLLPWFLLKFCKFLLHLWRCMVKRTYRYHYLCLYFIHSFDVLSNFYLW